MSLLKHLLTEGKKDVMVNKIGLPEQLADIIVSKFPKKYAMWIANSLMATALSAQYNTEIKSKSDYQSAKSKYQKGYKKDAVNKFLHGTTIRDFINKDLIFLKYQQIIAFIIQNNDMPNLNLKEIWTYEDVYEIMNEYVIVKDYLEGARPTPTVSSLSWDEAVQQAEQWHDELEASGKQLDIKEGQVIIHEFNDGYYWLDLDTNKCGDEGDAMGHCGNTDADTLLSLRDNKGEPHVTVAYDYDGTVRQMKGKGNDKPHEKYHEYIVEMFNNHSADNKAYEFIKYDPEYRPEDDFSLLDLNKDLLKEVKDNMDDKMFYEFFADTFSFRLFQDKYKDINDTVFHDMRDIFDVPDGISRLEVDKLKKYFEKKSSEEIIETIIDIKPKHTKYRGYEFITVAHFLDRKEDLSTIYNTIINYDDIAMFDISYENTSFSFIFAK